MKKIALSLFVSSFALTAFAQTITFKVNYKPSTVYTQSNLQTTKNEVSYKAPAEILEMLTAQGIENPTTTENKTNITGVMTTGKLAAAEMPITMKLSIDSGAEDKIIPDNTVIHGKVKQDGMPVFESIDAPGMDAATKDIFLKSMQATMAQVTIPERKVKVGETFVIDTPLSLPMGPATLKMSDKATYKLIKVEAKKAYFDVSHVYTIDSVVNDQEIKGTGTGTGKVVHDIENNFIVKQDVDMNMQMGFDTNGITLTIKANTVSALTCTIAPAK